MLLTFLNVGNCRCIGFESRSWDQSLLTSCGVPSSHARSLRLGCSDSLSSDVSLKTAFWPSHSFATLAFWGPISSSVMLSLAGRATDCPLQLCHSGSESPVGDPEEPHWASVRTKLCRSLNTLRSFAFCVWFLSKLACSGCLTKWRLIWLCFCRLTSVNFSSSSSHLTTACWKWDWSHTASAGGMLAASGEEAACQWLAS